MFQNICFHIFDNLCRFDEDYLPNPDDDDDDEATKKKKSNPKRDEDSDEAERTLAPDEFEDVRDDAPSAPPMHVVSISEEGNDDTPGGLRDDEGGDANTIHRHTPGQAVSEGYSPQPGAVMENTVGGFLSD